MAGPPPFSLARPSARLTVHEGLTWWAPLCSLWPAPAHSSLPGCLLLQAKLDVARRGYQPCGEYNAVLFFCIADLGGIDTMYQYR